MRSPRLLLLLLLLSSASSPAGAQSSSPSASASPGACAPAGNVSRYASSTLAFNGTGRTQDGPGSSAMIWGPAFLQLDPALPLLYVSGQTDCRLRVVNTTSFSVRTLVGSGLSATGTACTETDGVGTAATMGGGGGLALSASRRMLYVGGLLTRVRQVNLTTGVITTLAGNGSVATVNGVGTRASFGQPRGLAIDDASGILFVADYSQCSVRAVALASANVSTLAGAPGSCGFADGAALGGARFNQPCGMDFFDGVLYIAEALRVRALTMFLPGVAGAVTTLLTTTSASVLDTKYDGSNGLRSLIVSLYSTRVFLRLDLDSGVATAIAGSGLAGTTNGVGSAAAFTGPLGLAVAPGGSFIYVTDFGNNLLRGLRLLCAASPSPSAAVTPSTTGSSTVTRSLTAVATASLTGGASASSTSTLTLSPSWSSSSSGTRSANATATPMATQSDSPAPTASIAATASSAASAASSQATSPSAGTAAATGTASGTATASLTRGASASTSTTVAPSGGSLAPTASITATASSAASAASSQATSPSAGTAAATGTASGTATASLTRGASASTSTTAAPTGGSAASSTGSAAASPTGGGSAAAAVTASSSPTTATSGGLGAAGTGDAGSSSLPAIAGGAGGALLLAAALAILLQRRRRGRALAGGGGGSGGMQEPAPGGKSNPLHSGAAHDTGGAGAATAGGRRAEASPNPLLLAAGGAAPSARALGMKAALVRTHAPAPAPAAPVSESNLPPGWSEVFSKSKNRPYWRHTDGRTSWVVPAPTVTDRDADARAQPGEGGAAAATSGLPAGWTEAFSKSKNLLYWRHADGTTRWSRPQGHGGQGAYAKEREDAAQDAPLPLPTGWTETLDHASGAPYYTSPDGLIVQWERPL